MNRRTNKFYRQNEAEVMKSLGLKPTINSGAGWLEKEDGQSDHIIAQLKSTDKMSIGVNLKDINILEYNAAVSHKIPIFVLQFLQTDDVFIMVRPGDILGLNELIETGTTSVVQTTIIAPDEQETKSNAPVIKSGNREAFWTEKQMEQAERKREREQWKRK